MSETSSERKEKKTRHNKWLLLISAYKVLEAILFAAVGVGALRLVHQDVGGILDDLRVALHFSPESRLINFILDEASLLNDPILRRIGAVAFSYAAVSLAEGIGLYLEKAWGEWFTLAITASFLPWEVFEIFKRLTWVRVALLVINILVFLYLLKALADRRTKATAPGPV